MKSRHTRVRFALGLGATLAMLSGCAYESERTAQAPTAVVGTSTPIVVAQPTTTPRVVTYREGRWELRGDGSTSSPHYWAWSPSGAVIHTATPPPIPPAVLTGPTSSTPHVVTTSDGRWQLHGDGSAARPHLWVWTPRGANPPYPPIRYETPPTVTTTTPSTVTYREGSWELRGDGNNQHWVWVPAGVVMTTTAPPPVPQVVVTSAPSPTPQVLTTNDGRWQLYGDGTTARPHIWVWTPRGANPPPPPLR
jgi:hypothetical protein